MLKLYENLLNTLSSGKSCMIAATVEAKGSSPRSAGAYMLVDDTGRIYGTIGGGELEYQATFKAQELLQRGENALIEYDLSNETAAGLGMICGGRTKVLFRVFRKSDIPFAEKALSLARSRRPYHLLLPLGEGEAQVCTGLDAPRRNLDEQYYTEQFNFDGSVYLLGGGHLSQELVPLLSHLADIDCIRFALKTDAKYIGVVGSRRKVKFVWEKMLSEGFTEADLKRLTTPIGLSIGSETPAEIAVSIAAQLIQVRSGKTK